LSIILLELVPWGSSPYKINNQLDILKTPKSKWFNNDWCLATCDYPWPWLVHKR
jgi:hypothetical protein